MISFVMATRDDGYGGDAPGVENFTIYRLLLTCRSVQRLSFIKEIVIVDYAPEKSLKEYLRGMKVKLVTVDKEFHKLLRSNTTVNIPFYEYLAKHIGIQYTIGDTIVVGNPDNIFPKRNFPVPDPNVLHRAIRYEISREYARYSYDELIDMAENKELEYFALSYTAGGDFCMVSRDVYDKVQYKLMHGNWHCDNDFIERVQKIGIEIKQDYYHYHIHHDNAFVENITPTDFHNFQKISHSILAKWKEYVSVDIT